MKIYCEEGALRYNIDFFIHTTIKCVTVQFLTESDRSLVNLELNKCLSHFKPLLYGLYVDDCFLLFNSLEHLPLFLDFLIQQHANNLFTYELKKGRQSSLPRRRIRVF